MQDLEKFRPPIIRADLLRRARLEEAILQSVDRNAITLIVAPAGSGKSVLIAQAMQVHVERGRSCAWFGCDPFDRDRRRFLSLLQAAVQRLKEPPTETMHVSEALMSPGDPAAIIESASREGERLTLFIDNFHVCETPATASAIDALVQESGGLLHLVVTSRTPPKLALGHLRLRGLVGEFDPGDLAFTAQEASELMKGHNAPPGAADALKRILARTEGWAAAVQLVRILVEGGSDLRILAGSFSGADRDLRHFLNQEVFRTLSLETQEFLLRTSHLDRFSVDLAHHASGLADARKAFDDVVDRNLFVSALDRNGEWIRLHSVFRDYLEVLSNQRDPANGREVRTRAAEWHASKADWINAIEYAVRAEEWGLAAQWLADTGQDIVERQGETAAYLTYCESLPPSFLTDPRLLFWMIWATFFSSDYERGSRLLATHMDTIRLAPELASNAGLLQFLVALFTHRFKEASDLGARWLVAYPDATPFNRATISGGTALALKAQLSQPAAFRSLETSRNAIAQAASVYGEGWITTISAALSVHSGRILEARSELERYLAEAPATHSMRATVELVLADIYYELGEFAAARVLLARNMPSIARHAIFDTAFPAWRTEAFLAWHDEGPEAALRGLFNAEAVAMRRFGDYAVNMLRVLQNEIILLLNHSARRTLEHVPTEGREIPDERTDWCASLLESARLIDAQRALVSGLSKRALGLVQPVTSASLASGRLRAWAEAVCIKVSAMHVMGDTQASMRLFVECVEKCAPLGLWRTFIDRAVLLRPLGESVADYLRNAPAGSPDSVSRLLRAILESMGIRLDDDAAPAAEDTLEGLSSREVQLLSLAAQGLTNADIATRLVIKLPTVKSHFHNIFAKLDVQNRTTAISKARARGLIP